MRRLPCYWRNILLPLALSFALGMVVADAAGSGESVGGRALSEPAKARFSDFDAPAPAINQMLDSGHLNESRRASLLNPFVIDQKLEAVGLTGSLSGRPRLHSLPSFRSVVEGRHMALSPRREVVVYTVDSVLQRFTEQLVRKSAAPHVAAVLMEPDSGRILAISGKSVSLPRAALHSEYPAASLFKLITAAAALENSPLTPASPIRFRGGNYTLSQWNYRPNAAQDRRSMPLAEAMGKSCNPVFGRVALRYLSPALLLDYAKAFGFNRELEFDASLVRSRAVAPANDYELSRTAAGFGPITVSPVHAAALTAGIANNGRLPRPALIERIIAPSGAVVYRFAAETLSYMMSPPTARAILRMMETTTTIGTSRQEFMPNDRPRLPGIKVAAKTGTLSGKNPPGVNNWFVAAAPAERPTIAVAVVVVNPQDRNSKASRLGRLLLQKFFEL